MPGLDWLIALLPSFSLLNFFWFDCFMFLFPDLNLALILLLIPRKKQSPVEPDFDELDRVIQNKAIRISFVAVWFLWPMALILTMLKTGIAGNLPAILYLYVHLGVFLICMAIYFLTKIILYKNQTEGGVI
jgi:hypothetical protein